MQNCQVCARGNVRDLPTTQGAQTTGPCWSGNNSVNLTTTFIGPIAAHITVGSISIWRQNDGRRGDTLTFILLTWTIWRAPTNAMKWRMGFNSAFKGLKICSYYGLWDANPFSMAVKPTLHSMKAYDGVKLQLQSLILTSAVDGGEWSVSRPQRFTFRERATRTYWKGGWVSCSDGLVSLKETEISCPRLESNHIKPMARPQQSQHPD